MRQFRIFCIIFSIFFTLPSFASTNGEIFAYGGKIGNTLKISFYFPKKIDRSWNFTNNKLKVMFNASGMIDGVEDLQFKLNPHIQHTNITESEVVFVLDGIYTVEHIESGKNVTFKLKKIETETEEVQEEEEEELTEEQKRTLLIELKLKNPSMFKFSEWRQGARKSTFKQIEHTLLENIQNSAKGSINMERLKLGQFYLANDMPLAAIPIFDIIIKSSNYFAYLNKVKAMRGLANFMMYRIDLAYEDFSAKELDDINDEIKFWRQILGPDLDVMMKNSIEEVPFLMWYPNDIRWNLLIKVAEKKRKAEEYADANIIIDELEKEELSDDIADTLSLVRASILANMRKTIDAINILDSLTDHLDNRFIKYKSTYQKTALELQAKRISNADAIKKLENIKMIWHNDENELMLLKTLGELYDKEQRYDQAFKTWREIIINFPGTTAVAEAASKLTDGFIKVFDNAEIENRNPINVLSLYYGFQELTPIGKERNNIMSNIADTLISIDLIRNATNILEQQIYYILTGEERSRVALKTAKLHMIDDKPRKAIRILNATRNDPANDNIKQQRKYLLVRALIASEDYKKPIELLKGDTSVKADVLRFEVFWKEKNWKYLVDLGEKMVIGKEAYSRGNLLGWEMEVITKLAIAYAMREDLEGLKILEENFSPLLEDTIFEDDFKLMVRGNYDVIMPFNMVGVSTEIEKVEEYLE